MVPKLLSVIALSLGIGYFASNNENDCIFNELIENELYEESSLNTLSIDSEMEGEFNPSIPFSFTAPGVKDIKIESVSSHATYTIDGDTVSILYSNVSQDAESEIGFVFPDGETKIIELYFYILDGKTYYSFLSKDSLLRYLNISVDPNLDNDTIPAIFQDNNAENESVYKSSSVNGYQHINLMGIMQWANSNGDVFPLVGMKVKVVTENGDAIETYTSSSGSFHLSMNSVGNENPFTGVDIHIYAKSKTIEVFDYYGNLYEMCWNNVDLTQYGRSYRMEYTFSLKDADIGEAMQIAQAGKYYSDYITQLNDGNSIDNCSIVYPDKDAEGFHYKRSEKTIHIPKQYSSKTNLNSYEAWDVIGHEYGHHVQNIFGIANSPSGNHTSELNDADILADETSVSETAKDKGLRLAWGESWPTYWAITAQQSFPSDIQTIYTVGDAVYTASNGRDYSLDIYDSDSIKGEGCERSIMRFLYKLYSSETDETDKFALGDDTLWDIVVEAKPYRFHEFTNALYSKGYSKSDLGLLFEVYGMSATDPSHNVVLLSSNIIPTFSWKAGGGSTYFPNDTFALIFYDASKQLILKIENITATKYSLSDSEWSAILGTAGTTYFVMIEAKSSAYIESGPYYSSLHQFIKTGASLKIDDDLIQRIQ